MKKTAEKTAARRLQSDTDLSYSECLRIVRRAFADKMTVDEVLKFLGGPDRDPPIGKCAYGDKCIVARMSATASLEGARNAGGSR